MGSSLYSPGPMFPGSYVPRSGNIGPFLCFQKKGPMFPSFYKRVLCSPPQKGSYVPRFSKGFYVPRVLCSPFFAIGEHRTPFIKKGPMFPFSS